MKKNIGWVALVVVILGVSGCVSYPYIDDLERELEARNYNPDFTHSREPLAASANFDRTALIGQWECQVDLQHHILMGESIPWLEDHSAIEKQSFSFNADGTYSHISSCTSPYASLGEKEQRFSHEGLWKYEQGSLVLSQKNGTSNGQKIQDAAELRYRVVWFADGRALITEMDGERTFSQGEWKWRILTSTDRYGVQRQKTVHVNTVENGRERGYLMVKFTSPAVYTRVGGSVAKHGVGDGHASPVSANYRITQFERLKDKDFSYAFELELPGGGNATNLREIGRTFGAEVKQSYIDTFHSAKPDELRVLLDWRLENGLLKGVASVVNVVPVMLAYDAKTHTGRMVVRADGRQLSEARAWICKNVRKIACDKNIALETGVRPAEDAHYSIVRETVKDGSLVEVEFKVE